MNITGMYNFALQYFFCFAKLQSLFTENFLKYKLKNTVLQSYKNSFL